MANLLHSIHLLDRVPVIPAEMVQGMNPSAGPVEPDPVCTGVGIKR